MELLGPSIKQLVKGPVSVTTSTRVIRQMLSALEHIHGHGFVHRDIKPENMLLSLRDPSKLKLIDLGIARPFTYGAPSKYDPFLEKKYIVGTLNWASLNSHNGVALAPRDDLESLAYTAFYLLRGTLPWKRPLTAPSEPYLRSLRRITAAKTIASGKELRVGFPAEFGYLLDYSRKLEYNQTPDYDALGQQFVGDGGVCVEAPLDWSIVEVSIAREADKSGLGNKDDEKNGEDDLNKIEDEDSSQEKFSESYFEMDLDMYDLQRARDRSMTLPAEQASLVASRIPGIGIIEEP